MVSILLGVAHAQPRAEQKAEADRLFEEGRALLADGKRDEACDRFEQSFKKDPRAVGTMLNLGLCREEVGRIASAIRFYAEARDRARDQKLSEHEEAAQRKIALLAPRVPRLAIEPPPKPGPKLRVLLDDQLVPLDQLDDITVDPGSHTLVVTEIGKLPWETTLNVAESQRQTIRVPALEGIKTVVVREHASPRALWGKIATASGAALAVAGLGLGLYARSYYWDQFPAAARDGKPVPRDTEHPCWTTLDSSGAITRTCSQLGSERIDNARQLAQVSTAVTIGGGLVAVGGLVLWLTAPSAAERTQVDVAVFGDGASFTVSGAF
jgi:tetratricopeptide (TPR) repeat protein